MKHLFIAIIIVFCANTASAQAPEKMTYQAVVRNGNNLVTNAPVGMKISILQGSATGSPSYVETHTINSNSNGLVTIEIGNGTVLSGSFSTIDWGNGPYYLMTECDPTGGTNYSVTGTTELLSVPYALYSKTSGDAPTVITDSISPPASAWVSIGPSSYQYSYTNPNITQDVVSKGLIQVSSYYSGTGVWQVWPFYSLANNANYDINYKVNTIIFRAHNVSVIPVVPFKIVIHK